MDGAPYLARGGYMCRVQKLYKNLGYSENGIQGVVQSDKLRTARYAHQRPPTTNEQQWLRTEAAITEVYSDDIRVDDVQYFGERSATRLREVMLSQHGRSRKKTRFADASALNCLLLTCVVGR